MTCMAWGRALIGGNGGKDDKSEARRINVIATGSVDQTVKVGCALRFRRKRADPDLDPLSDRG